jgi:hypothetical protein
VDQDFISDFYKKLHIRYNDQTLTQRDEDLKKFILFAFTSTLDSFEDFSNYSSKSKSIINNWINDLWNVNSLLKNELKVVFNLNESNYFLNRIIDIIHNDLLIDNQNENDLNAILQRDDTLLRMDICLRIFNSLKIDFDNEIKVDSLRKCLNLLSFYQFQVSFYSSSKGNKKK